MIFSARFLFTIRKCYFLLHYTRQYCNWQTFLAGINGAAGLALLFRWCF